MSTYVWARVTGYIRIEMMVVDGRSTIYMREGVVGYTRCSRGLADVFVMTYIYIIIYIYISSITTDPLSVDHDDDDDDDDDDDEYSTTDDDNADNAVWSIARRVGAGVFGVGGDG